MLILGINGWMERGHDAAACLLLDGRIVAMAEEERFNRRKHAFDCLPVQAIAYCLAEADVGPDDLDAVAWGWDLPYLHAFYGRDFTHTDQSLNRLLFPRGYYPKRSKDVPVHFVRHHLSHAASVYACRTDEVPVGIAVLDGSGEDVSISLFRGNHGTLTELATFPISVSPGFFYEAGCQLLGFRRIEGGKLMGLASYGSPVEGFDSFFVTNPAEKLRPVKTPPEYSAGRVLDWEDEVVGWWSAQLSQRWPTIVPARYQYDAQTGVKTAGSTFTRREFDIAATIQAALENVYDWVIGETIRLAQTRVIGVSGGVALNCSANGRVLESRQVDQLIVQPAAGDAGVALGAALSLHGSIPPRVFTHPYWGPEFSHERLAAFLKESKVAFTEPDNFTGVVADAISRGQVVGWFQGRMEVGPRALGARSILADPRSQQTSTVVNTIKSRELWRPLAPMMRAEDSAEYLMRPGQYPYMLVRNFIRPDKKDVVPAIVHVDGSVRPQTVDRQAQSLLHQLLTDFNSIAGVPVLLNTSFNAGYEPIVCSPADAVRTFFTTGLDLLVLGPFLIAKRSNQ
ncbi:MAG: carbamoyltransferase C-terminal domain-containing protein [Patescibacteria group bacterium]